MNNDVFYDIEDLNYIEEEYGRKCHWYRVVGDHKWTRQKINKETGYGFQQCIHCDLTIEGTDFDRVVRVYLRDIDE